jgi:hypothetical protein
MRNALSSHVWRGVAHRMSRWGLTGMLDGYFYAYPAGAAPRLTVPRLAWCYFGESPVRAVALNSSNPV